MKINEFVNGYNAAAKKEEYIKKHIVVNYIPYENKCETCRKIVFSTTHIEKDGNLIYKKNSPAQYMFFVLNIISQYTDIDIDMADALSCFNELEMNRLIDAVVSCIPNCEYISYKTILEMENDDAYENDRSIMSYLDIKIGELKYIFELFNPVIDEVVRNVKEKI